MRKKIPKNNILTTIILKKSNQYTNDYTVGLSINKNLGGIVMSKTVENEMMKLWAKAKKKAGNGNFAAALEEQCIKNIQKTQSRKTKKGNVIKLKRITNTHPARDILNETSDMIKED